MIAEALAGKRIAITGGDRVRRHGARRAPAAQRARLRAGPARAATASARRPPSASGARSSRTTPSTGCGAAARRRGETFDEMTARRITTIAGDVSTDGLGLTDADRADASPRCDIVIHSAAAVSFDSPLDSAVEINLLGPTRIAAAAATSSASRPHLVAVSHVLRRRQPPRHRARGARQRRAVRHRARLARRGRRRPAPARRRRGGQPHARAARRVPHARPAPSSAPPARRRWPPRPSSCASGGSRDQLVEAGRARAASVGWPDAYAFTKALGEQALTETKGDVPVSDRAPVDHRVGVGRAAPGLDPRLPHGRAGASSPTPAAC